MKFSSLHRIAVLFLSFFFPALASLAGNAVTPFNQSFCNSTYPSGFVTGTIKISSTTAGAFNSNQTNRKLDIVLPAGFAFNVSSGASVVFAQNQSVTSASAVVMNSRRIRLTISNGNGNGKKDSLTISFQIRANIAPVTSTSSIIRRSDSTDIGNANRFRIDNSFNKPSASLGLLNSGYTVAYASAAVTQPVTTTVYAGTTDNQVLQIAVTVSGTCGSINVSQLNFSTNGNNGTGTDNSLNTISSARVYYTGTSNAFANSTQFGSVASPNGAFTVSGLQSITTAGTYYFWLTYNLTSTAVSGNRIDASVSGITVGGVNRSDMTTPSPAGSRTVSTQFYYSLATGNWNNPLLWSSSAGGVACNCIPNGPVYAVISPTHTVTINGNYTVDVVEIRDGATLQDNATNVLTVNQTLLTLNSGRFTANSSWVVNSINTSGTGNSIVSKPLTASGDVTINTGSKISLLGTGDITIQKNLTLFGTLDATTRSINLTGVNAIVNGNGLVTGINGLVSITGAKTIPASAALNIEAAVNIGTNAVVTNSGTVTIQNNVTGSNSGSAWINNSASTLNVTGSLLSTGTLTATATDNLVNYNGNAAQTVKAASYYNARAGGTTASVKTLGGAITVLNNLTIANAAVLDAGTFNITLSGNWIATTSATNPFNSNAATVVFNGLTNVTGTVTTFNNISVSGTLVAHPVNMNIKGSFANAGDFNNNDATISFTGTSTISGTSPTVFDNAIVNTGALLTAHSVDTYIEGDFTVNGTFNHNSGTIIFNGTDEQFVGGSSTVAFGKLTLDNSGNSGVTLTKPVTVNTTMTFVDGFLNTTSANVLRFAAGATNTGSTLTSFVRGPVVSAVAASGTSVLFFPFGKADIYRPVTLTVNHSNTTSVDYTAEMKNTNAQTLAYTLPTFITHVSTERYYIINRSGVNNLTTATVKLTYGADDGVSDPAKLRIVKNVGTQWVDMGGTGTAATAGTITSGSFNAFSIFTLGNATGGSNVLPVQLAAFTAVPAENKVRLAWTTESEINSAYFEVERSVDGRTFEVIGTVAAAGMSTSRNDYDINDSHPASGENYYRLRMVDNDGTFEYSAIRLVTMRDETSQTQASFYPNPVTNGTLYLNTGFDGSADYMVYDASGRIVRSGSTADNGSAALDLSSLNAGAYLLRDDANQVVTTKQLIVQ